MKNLVIIFALFATSFYATAQRTCGTMDHLAHQIANDPNVLNNMQAIETHTAAYTASNKKKRTLVTIPVVFHVVYANATQNIADAAIFAQLNQLNLDFSLSNTDTNNIPGPFKSLAANTDIQFCLAVRDPNGNPTTGITRTSTTVASFGTNNNIKFTASGGKDAWPTTDYLNIWIGYLGTSLLGYAQFPGGAAATDGVVVTYTSVGSMLMPNAAGNPYDLGRTATHEVGHWLNLRHIWGDDNNCTGTDQVGDTPNQEVATYGCATYPLLDACATVSPGAMFMNYMDYVDDNCMNMFTAGQKTRTNALFATGGFRVSLLTSLGCVPLTPCAGTPNAGTIIGSNDTLCVGSTKLLTLNGQTVAPGITYQWQQSSTAAGPWTNVAGTNANYTAVGTPGTMYYRCLVNCTNTTPITTDSTAPFAVHSYGVSSINSPTICSAGSVTLTANAVGVVNWYTSSAGGTPVYVGNPYITTVTGSTTFYANVGATSNYTVGPVDYSIGATSTSNSFSNGEIFHAYTNLTIDTVYAYPSGAGVIAVVLIDSATNATITTYTQTVTAAQVNTKIPLLVNFSCNAGTTYRMYATGSTVNGLYRNTAGASHPYTLAGIIQIRRTGSTTNFLTTYRYFYDWKLHSGCINPLVSAPIVIAPAIISTSNAAILCNGNATSIAANVGPGYSYSINGGTANTTGIFNNIFAGNYTISAANSTGCATSSIVNISQPNALSMVVNSTNNTASCNGSLTINASGGTIAYQYQINGGVWTSSNVFNNLCTGNYTVCVKDANNCSTCQVVTVNSLNSINVSATATSSCANNNTGSITASVIGGVGPYQYSLNGAAYQSNNTFNNLPIGTYTISAIDGNNITNSTSISIAASNLNMTASAIAATGSSICNGSISAITNGGTAPYSYNIGTTIQANNTFNNLCTGSYTVCVTDNNGCQVCDSISIQVVVPITISTPIIIQACSGMANGSITALAANGTSPYQYQINTGGYSSNPQFNNLVAGIYTVTAKDLNNATISTVVSLNLSANLSLSIAATNIDCYNNCNGSIVAVANNGVASYNYTLNGGTSQTTTTFSNLCSGVYTIMATDANTCTKTTLVSITAPTALANIVVINNISCNGLQDGSATITTSGGITPYQYNMNGGTFATNNIFNNLTANTYTFNTVDANGCTATVIGSVSNPPLLAASASSNPGLASITATGAGGTVPYTYSLNGANAVGSNVFSPLAAGTYTITIIDAKGCKSSTIISLEAPESINNFNLLNAINIFPNPSNGIVNLNVNSNQNIGILKIQLYNNLGQIIQREIFEVNGKKGTKVLNLAHLPKANYTLQIIDEHNAIANLRIMLK